MVMWGAILGAILGLAWPGGDRFDLFVLGAALGAIGGATLRSAIRNEVRKALADPSLAPAQWRAAAAAGSEAARAAPLSTPAPAFTPPEPTAEPGVAPVASPTPAFEDTVPPPAAPPVVQAPAAPRQPDLVTLLVQRARDWLLGGNTVVRVGVLVLFVGLAFLAKYAIDNALLPPELRLAGIAIAGIALLVTGFRLRGRGGVHAGYGITLQGAGVAVLYLTVFAAFRLYHFLPAQAAFAALALVCAFSAVIAVKQDALALAFIAFAGGFAAPLLVSTGEGSHVALFSYYLLLGVAIAVISWMKAWRALNLLGFFATFAIATAWGALRYDPKDFATTEPFLIAFFAVYLVAALAYSLRHSLARQRAVDGTLVFGVPLIGFGLQAVLVRDMPYASAFSALALGALYLALAAWMLRTRREGDTVRGWLAECFLALGLGFTTLAVPLALEARWTSAVWAVEGAAVYWMGRRQGRWLARTAGLVLQALAAIAFLDSEVWERSAAWPVANAAFIGCAMLAGSALLIASLARTPRAGSESAMDAKLDEIERFLAPVLFWVGFLWGEFALWTEIFRSAPDAAGGVSDVYSGGLKWQLLLLAWVTGAFVAHFFASPAGRRPWGIAATPAWTTLPVMFVSAIGGALFLGHVFQSGGWIVWPLVLAMHITMLRRLDGGAPQRWWFLVHTGGVWLLVLLAGNLLVYAVGKADLWRTAWASVILLVASIAVLLALSLPAWFRMASEGRGWPLGRFGRAYLWVAAAPLALAVAVGSLLVAVHSDGNARPLPYVPLLNPTDLSVALGLAACALWLARIRSAGFVAAPLVQDRRVLLALGAVGFIALNTVWLRVAHHYAGVPWDAGALFDSFLVQAGYSILWTLLAVGLMVAAHRRAQRPLWMAGASLLGLTVLKLFVIDLSNRGGSERIVVFIAVGLLMLVVGYFAPVPPGAGRANAALKEST